MTAAATLPIEGRLPELGGATAWLNSEPLTPAGLRGQVKVMIGGAPVTPEYAAEIGADGYADNASSAVAKARELIAA